MIPTRSLYGNSVIWMGIYAVVMGDRGRIVVPAAVRERAGLSAGTPLVVVESSEGLILLTREQLRARIRDELSNADLVGQLLADRRRASVREDAG